ncbi:hypothetical protein AU106_gp049 [Sinorhizobium phage phiM9]|uniref:Uncharacterized protein n=1 Tax=Sinorhizobium phage phiM9 TaxID=1636182 RepID=A0A0F6R5S2_9CAUD|nr:hypothetical protein AU106_gp049 [Sinorhizobium phage phiM9]AKE44680.1 hypothetical protein Sm_phiM9_050 [Sinorhizobium phage phiM9]
MIFKVLAFVLDLYIYAMNRIYEKKPRRNHHGTAYRKVKHKDLKDR